MELNRIEWRNDLNDEFGKRVARALPAVIAYELLMSVFDVSIEKENDSDLYRCKIYLRKLVELCGIEENIILYEAQHLFGPNGDLEARNIHKLDFILSKNKNKSYIPPNEKTLPGVLRLFLMNRFGFDGVTKDETFFSKYEWIDDKERSVITIRFLTDSDSSYFESNFQHMALEALTTMNSKLKINYHLELVDPSRILYIDSNAEGVCYEK